MTNLVTKLRELNRSLPTLPTYQTLLAEAADEIVSLNKRLADCTEACALKNREIERLRGEAEGYERTAEAACKELGEIRAANEPIAEHHLQPRYVLEQIMNNSTDSWAKGVARTCLMGSPVKSGAPQYTVKQHGVDCPKVEHLGEGYLHAADDDRPYDVDGVTYCGRCHGWIDTIGRSCVRT